MIAMQPYILFRLKDETGTAAGLRVFFRRGESAQSAGDAARLFAARLGALSSLTVESFEIVFRSVAEADTRGIPGSDSMRCALLFVGEDEMNGDIVEIPVIEEVLIMNECIEVPDVNHSAFQGLINDLESGFYTMDDGLSPLIVEAIATGRNYGTTISEWMAGI